MLSEPEKIIQNMLSSQLFGVLNTWDGEKPYSNLITLASTGGISEIFFATNQNTRKYKLLKLFPKVSLLIDDRSNLEIDLQKATAISCHGEAIEIYGKERSEISRLYIIRHPTLQNFIQNPDCTIFKIEVSEYIISGFKDTLNYRLNP